MGSTSSSDNVRQFIESAVNSNKVVIWYVTVANFFSSLFLFSGVAHFVIFRDGDKTDNRSKSYCPYCTQTKNLFQQQLGITSAFVYELDQQPDGNAIQQELLVMTGQRTVPSVFIAGKHLGGNDASQAAYRSGALMEMLK